MVAPEQMEDVDVVKAQGAEVLFLKPDEITVDPQFNMRPYTSKAAHEQEEIAELAGKIAKDGQLNPGIVKENGSGKYVLLAGHRRLAAIRQLNDSGTPTRMRVTVHNDGDPRQIAFSDNWDRKNPSHMDTAYVIQNLRKEMGEGMAGAGKIARYLGVDKATVIQHEKLLGASKVVQKALHEGVMAMDSALDLIENPDVPEEKHEQVIEEAKKIQAEEIDEKIKRVKEARKDKKEKAAGKTSKGAEKQMKALEKAKAEKRVKAPAVKKAIKKVVPDAKVKPGMREVREFAEALLGPGYGYPDGAVQVWAASFLGWMAGEVGERSMQNKFDAMVKKAEQGTKGSLKMAEEKAGKGKAKPRAAKNK